MYKIKKARNGQFHWSLVARNGKMILTASEQYTTKENCIKSIEATRTHVRTKIFLDKKIHAQILAKNGEQLAKTQVYKTRAGLYKGMKSIRKHLLSPIKDLTK